MIFLRDLDPRVFFERFERKCDFLPLDVYDFYLYVIPNFEHRARVFYQRPINLGNVNESLKRVAKAHKCAEVHDTRDFSFYDVSRLVLRQSRARLVACDTLFAEDEFLLSRIKVYNFEPYGSTDELLQFLENALFIAALYARVVFGRELACRQKALDAFVLNDESPAVCFKHGQVNGFSGVAEFFQDDPALFFTRFFEGKLYKSFFVIKLYDFGIERVAWLERLDDVFRGFVLAAVYDAGALGSEVYKKHAAALFNHEAFGDIARFQKSPPCIFEQEFHGMARPVACGIACRGGRPFGTLYSCLGDIYHKTKYRQEGL